MPSQTVWSVYTFRPPTEAELDRYWSTIFYIAETVERHIATRDEALAKGLAAWSGGEFSEAYVVRNERLPNAEGVEEAGWHVFKLRLSLSRELDDIADEELPAYVYELGSPPFTERKGAEWEAKKRWQGGDGQVGLIVRAEVLEKAELTRRRMQQRGYLTK